MTIKCITFDLDDTLWDCAPVIQHAERLFYAWLAEHQPRITRNFSQEQLLSHRHRWFMQRPELLHDFTTLRKAWMSALAEQFDYDQDSVEAGFRVFWEARNQVKPYDDALETLETLKPHFVIGAITNGNADVHHIGIGHYFDFVVTASGAGAAKPAPEIFMTALDEAGVAASNALHVGDDAERDVRGAQQVGMRSAWVNPRKTPWQGSPQPDVIVTHVAELTDWLLGPAEA
ncbi:putative hydrolase of the HAD superfamily [Ectothiorhodosinus mongolicus]|uniref:Putative hydrolase of the HAD superfamily n=1 Tax=Ectothiorhodosinus mongolicus TaxID=233100 RepID=A0A1R3VQJ3_9GAMM|nr:HAD family hydrolase [Ectothiorhodosinus mongolicus]ULX56313.1 HAD family hydrolase [Ectothiorhodosinus mongolicus]SIT65823.1 putative hydrolase of the HAD superfamily [Ectothiorhodosinus mongolicus]